MTRSLRSIPVLAFVLANVAVSASADELLPAEKPIHEVIDHYVTQLQQADDVQSAALIDDSNLIRRTTLDIAGRIPTSAEARAFVQSQEPHKRAKLVDRLLGGPGFAWHQRNELDALLMAGYGNDKAWRDYLLKAVRENRGWDRMFRDMMVGNDDVTETKAALTFLRKRGKSVDDMTNDTSRLFFGVAINCAQCHDHPLVDDWKQDHFFGLKSFFNRTYLTKKDTLAEKHRGTIKFKTTAGEEKQAKFMFLTGSVIDEPKNEKTKKQIKAEADEVRKQLKDKDAPPAKAPEFSPRRQLVEVALKSGDDNFFARSIVNRVWARLLGQGLAHPLDQMHSENPASHPELLDWLTRDLAAHNYDLKRLIRGIVLSDTYARSSRFSGAGDPPGDEYFAVAIPRPLSPRQYSLSLMMATTNPDQFPADQKPEEWQKRREALEKAAEKFAGQFEQPTEHFQVSVDEALLFSNNSHIENDFLRDSGDKLIGHLKQIEDAAAMIEAAYWAILSRAPSEEESQVLTGYLEKRKDRREEGLRQVVWALITNPELRFNY